MRRTNLLRCFFLGVLAAVLLISLSGCVSKGITKPRSEVLKEAESDGIQVASVEEDKQLFMDSEKQQQERLIELLKSRSLTDSNDPSYVIGAGDDIEINVFDVPELNVTAKVKGSGFINLPLVGAVMAAGKTESNLLEELRKRLASFVKNPQINLFIAKYGSQRVAVMGAVRKPGTYALKKGDNTILELMSLAGGVSDKAGNFVNFIPAEDNPGAAATDVETRARMSLAASLGTPHEHARGFEIYLDQVLGTTGGVPLEIPVRAGDMIIVPEAGKIMVEGEVEKPGQIELGQQMTLLSALASAGGITYSAKPDEVEIVRDLAGRKAHLIVDLESVARGEGRDVRLRNGDIVRVPSDSGRRMRQDTFESITKIFNVGVGGSVPMR